MIPKYTMRSQHSKFPSLEHSAYIIIMSPCLSLCIGSMKKCILMVILYLRHHDRKPKLPMQLISAVLLQHSTYNFCCLISLNHNFMLFVFNQDSSRTNFISTFCATEPRYHTSFVTALSRKPSYWTLWAVSWQWYQRNELENAVKETSMILKSSPSMILSPKQAKGQSCPPAPWPIFGHLSTAVDLPAAFSGQELTEVPGKKPDIHPES